MNATRPTVGRVVWFYKHVEGQGFKGPLAAYICHVHSDSMVNLMVIDQNGNPRSETSVPLEQTALDAPRLFDKSYCTWPKREETAVEKAARRGFEGRVEEEQAWGGKMSGRD